LPRRAPRSWIVVVSAFLVAGTSALATTAATGIEPRLPGAIPDSAFHPVTLVAPAPPAAPAATSSPSDPTRGSTSEDSALRDPRQPTPPSARANPSLPTPRAIVVAGAPRTSNSIAGTASWYCRAGWSPCTIGHPDHSGIDAYAAAGPALRAAIGPSWHGTIVLVDGLRVKLIDWCQCHKGEPSEKLLDLYYDVFARTGSRVTVRW